MQTLKYRDLHGKKEAPRVEAVLRSAEGPVSVVDEAVGSRVEAGTLSDADEGSWGTAGPKQPPPVIWHEHGAAPERSRAVGRLS